MTEFVIKAGANVNIQNNELSTPLHLCASNEEESSVDIIKTLIASGADPSKKDVNDEQPLHYAAASATQNIQPLLEAGADINAQNKDGATPLHLAIEENNAEAIKTLLEAGANLAIENANGKSCACLLRESEDPAHKQLLAATLVSQMKSAHAPTRDTPPQHVVAVPSNVLGHHTI
jgi:ankyrin repeat protein